MRIRPIAPALADDFVALFDGAFADNPYWSGCYCAYYDDPCADADWVADASGRDRNRARKRALIESGGAHGLLADIDGSPVGWCNAGPRRSYANLRTYAAAIDDPDEAVGCVMCFVVHPDHRGEGVATAMLDAVDGYFASLGLTVAEAYPRLAPPASPDFPWTAAFYKGTVDMYERAGFTLASELEGFGVMRKQLQRVRPSARRH